MNPSTTEHEPRVRLSPSVSPEMASRWQDFATRNGVSVTALIEALAPSLGSDARFGPVVRKARHIDARNRQRSPRRRQLKI